MLLAGNPTGINELNTYDAACLAWAFLDEQWSATAETLNPEGSLKLRHELLGTLSSEMETLVEMRTEMGMDPIAAASIVRPPRPQSVVKDELAEMRAMLSRDSPAT